MCTLWIVVFSHSRRKMICRSADHYQAILKASQRHDISARVGSNVAEFSNADLRNAKRGDDVEKEG